MFMNQFEQIGWMNDYLIRLLNLPPSIGGYSFIYNDIINFFPNIS